MPRKKKKPRRKPKPRNPVARAPILRKGGPHGKSKSAERRRKRDQTERELAEWD